MPIFAPLTGKRKNDMKNLAIREILWVGCLLWSLAAAARQEVPVSQWGVRGDGVTLNTRQLQQAINDLAGQGGGKLCFPAGCYLTGSLQLRNGVELYLEQGATLLGSSNPAHYTALQKSQDLERNDNGLGRRGECLRQPVPRC